MAKKQIKPVPIELLALYSNLKFEKDSNPASFHVDIQFTPLQYDYIQKAVTYYINSYMTLF